jgi:uncharacterized protein (DUF1330 family)
VTAYWINTFVQITDEDKVARYAALAGDAMTAAGGRFLARGNPAHTFEEARDLRTALIEFDSVDAAVAAYNSPEYQDALRVLDGGARRQIRIMDGLD